MANLVAIVTGASSGIGLALSKHLVSKGWHVVLFDINPPPKSASLPSDKTLFIQCDVSSWDAQSSAFSKAFELQGRLDAAALNAGIDDRDDIFNSVDPNTPPNKPNLATFEINLLGVYYGVKLAAHYMSRTSSSKPKGGGKIVITASAAGLYALPAIPQYSAAKHGIVGLTRALAPGAAENNMTINAICPAMVPTNLAPPGLMDHFPEDQTTPMSTMMRAYDELLDEKLAPNGQIVEAAVQNLFYREKHKPLSESQKRMSKGTLDVWANVYRERNKAFAARDWEGAKVKREHIGTAT